MFLKGMIWHDGGAFMKTNSTREKLRNGGTCIGTMVREIRSPQIVQLLAACGWDFVIVDTEHGFLDMQAVADFSAVARREEVTLIARVPDNLYHLLARPLDVGVEGVLCPRVDSREEAEQIVMAVKYAPVGDRGVSISGVATGYRAMSTRAYLDYSNANSMIAVQIESTLALENVGEILAVEGIDAAFIGPEDLSQSMGIPGEIQHPRMLEAYQHVIDAANRHSVAPGMHFRDLEMMKEWMGKGMRFVAYKTDFRLLQEVSQNALKILRG
jgi:2-keto-3-deoxy-L-rhamnonate aldolase RhmA